MKQHLKKQNQSQQKKKKAQFMVDILFSAMTTRKVDYWSKNNNDQSVKVCLVLDEVGIKSIFSFVRKDKQLGEWSNRVKLFLTNLYHVSSLDTPQVIIGESGTGKESMARAMHKLKYDEENNQINNNFIVFDAAAANHTTINSELFGHVKGAYTSADRDRKGILEIGSNSTVFIDELGKVPHDIQAKLLRVIEYKTFKKMGEEKETKLNNVNFVISLQPTDLTENKILLDVKNRLNLHTAIWLPPLSKRLKRDKGIVFDVLRKILQKDDIIRVIKDSGVKTRDVKEKIYSDDAMIKLLSLVKTISDYESKRDTVNKECMRFGISEKAYKYLSYYKGYENKNFRELYSILESALIKAIANRRNIIEKEDLNDIGLDDLKPSNEKNDYNVEYFGKIKDTPLIEIIEYAEKIKKKIVVKKIKEVLKEGKNVKSTLMKEGMDEDDYVNYYSKLTRITGPINKLNRKQKNINQ